MVHIKQQRFNIKFHSVIESARTLNAAFVHVAIGAPYNKSRIWSADRPSGILNPGLHVSEGLKKPLSIPV